MQAIGNKLHDRKVLITGGLGMIGTTLAHRLVHLGANVTLVDLNIAPYGANLFNIEGIRDQVTVNFCDIRDPGAIKTLVCGKDIIFNLAGQVSHNDSIENPALDADINYLGHLNVLENVRRHSPEAVIIHSGSRLQFGKVEYNPVDEKHPLRPRTPYALNKTAAENSYLFYNQVHGIRCVLFRIANPYGPRSQMRHNKYSMINWFIRQAMEDRVLKVFGTGEQVRDYIYVDDLADAMIQSAVTPGCFGEVFNIGSGLGTQFREMVETIVKVVGSGKVEFVPWPEAYINIETGDYVSDITKLRKFLSWAPAVPLAEGIERTHDYYRKHHANYWQFEKSR